MVSTPLGTALGTSPQELPRLPVEGHVFILVQPATQEGVGGTITAGRYMGKAGTLATWRHLGALHSFLDEGRRGSISQERQGSEC